MFKLCKKYATPSPNFVNNYITNSNPNTKFIPQKENQIWNVSFGYGVGLGMKVNASNVSISAIVKYAAEQDLFYEQEVRHIMNAEIKALGTGASFTHDTYNKRIYDEYSLLYFSNANKDLKFNFGIEGYLGVGAGISVTVNISEIMRRVSSLFNGGCK